MHLSSLSSVLSENLKAGLIAASFLDNIKFH